MYQFQQTDDGIELSPDEYRLIMGNGMHKKRDLRQVSHGMTTNEFDNTRFFAGMTCIHKGKLREIVSLDFDEQLIGLTDEHDKEQRQWVRCENIELMK